MDATRSSRAGGRTAPRLAAALEAYLARVAAELDERGRELAERRAALAALSAELDERERELAAREERLTLGARIHRLPAASGPGPEATPAAARTRADAHLAARRAELPRLWPG